MAIHTKTDWMIDVDGIHPYLEFYKEFHDNGTPTEFFFRVRGTTRVYPTDIEALYSLKAYCGSKYMDEFIELCDAEFGEIKKDIESWKNNHLTNGVTDQQEVGG